MYKNVIFTNHNDFFTSTTNATDNNDIKNSDSIVEIPLSELFPPEYHPFNVSNDEAMKGLVKSIKQHGVLEPGLARTRKEGGYELLSGNRRKMACELASLPTMPIVLHKMDDDNAIIAIVNSNLEHREKLLPSEKAWAYRLKMEALHHKGVKWDKLSVEIMSEQTGDSKNKSIN